MKQKKGNYEVTNVHILILWDVMKLL